MKNEFKLGKVAILGEPNSGKSTLINKIIRKKISIVSHKAQTTRNNIIGILNDSCYQIIFYDTPGYQTKYIKHENRLMNKYVVNTISEANLILMLHDVKKKYNISESVLRLLSEIKNKFLILTKIDLIKNKNNLLPIINKISQKNIFSNIIPVSSKQNENLDLLIDEILKSIPFGEKKYSSSEYTISDENFMLEEVIREKILLFTNDELPYKVKVLVQNLEKKENICTIDVNILIPKLSYKPIIIGHKGQLLKKISTYSRIDMQKILKSKVFLRIWVKFRKDDLMTINRLGKL